jgi:hypothetical protein
LIETVPELSSHYSTVYGINCHSPLQELNGFSVVEGGMIPDLIHDILEGALPLELKNMLKVLICDLHLFTLDHVNEKFKTLGLQYMDDCVPVPLEASFLADGSLKQNASQMWTLALFLPIVVDLVPQDNEYWGNFINLLSIINIVFAPKLNKSDCGYLETLINDHHTTFLKLYPHLRINPKLHYMTNLPRLILQYRKHQYY